MTSFYILYFVQFCTYIIRTIVALERTSRLRRASALRVRITWAVQLGTYTKSAVGGINTGPLLDRTLLYPSSIPESPDGG